MDVDLLVEVVVPEGGLLGAVHRHVVLLVPVTLRVALPQPGQVVHDGEDDDADDVYPRSAVGAQRPGLERVAHGHESF